MNQKGDSSDQSKNDDKTGERHEPDAGPPDLDNGRQKAFERGRWLREAIIKGGVSGAVRALVEEGLNYLP